MQTETMVYTHDAVFFCDTLTYSTPYISNNPRNHDSLAFVTDGTLGYEKQGRTIQIKQGQIAYIAKGSIDKSSAYGCDAVSYIVKPLFSRISRDLSKDSSLWPTPELGAKTPTDGLQSIFGKHG